MYLEGMKKTTKCFSHYSRNCGHVYEHSDQKNSFKSKYVRMHCCLDPIHVVYSCEGKKKQKSMKTEQGEKSAYRILIWKRKTLG
jgi:hypothetical protein